MRIFKHAFVKFVENSRLKTERVGELCANGVSRVTLVKLGKRAMEHGLSDNQFTDKIHHCIDAARVDTKTAFGNGGDRGTCLGRFGCFPGFAALDGIRHGLRGLGFEKITKQFMFRSFRGRSTLDANVGNDARNTATLLDGLFGLRAGERGFHDFDVGRGQIIFGAEGYRALPHPWSTFRIS